jgi:hypothetical protein
MGQVYARGITWRRISIEEVDTKRTWRADPRPFKHEEDFFMDSNRYDCLDIVSPWASTAGKMVRTRSPRSDVRGAVLEEMCQLGAAAAATNRHQRGVAEWFDFYIDLISATRDRRDRVIETITRTRQLDKKARARSNGCTVLLPNCSHDRRSDVESVRRGTGCPQSLSEFIM